MHVSHVFLVLTGTSNDSFHVADNIYLNTNCYMLSWSQCKSTKVPMDVLAVH